MTVDLTDEELRLALNLLTSARGPEPPLRAAVVQVEAKENAKMTDDPSKRGSQDRQRINIHEDYELRYWSENLACPKTSSAAPCNTWVRWSITSPSILEKHPPSERD